MVLVTQRDDIVSNFDLKKWWTLDPDAKAASKDNPLTPHTIEQRRPGRPLLGLLASLVVYRVLRKLTHPR